jgi:hypothetical protein
MADEKADKTLDQIKTAMQGGDVSLHLVKPMAISIGGTRLGTGVQVKVKNRKTGPVIFPAEGETVADVLKWLGDLAVQ